MILGVGCKEEAAAPMAAVSASPGFDPETSRLLAALEDPVASVHYAASRELAAKGAAVRPALLSALKSERPMLRAMAAHALAGMGEGAEEALPGLAAVLEKDADPKVRESAARAIGLVGRKSALKSTLVSALRKGLADAEGPVRVSSAFALAALDSGASEAAAVLGKALNDPEPEGTNLHQEACFRLASMGPAAKDAVPGLIAMLQNPDPEMRWPAVEALGKIGPGAAAAQPALKLLRKKSNIVGEKDAITKALEAIED